MFSAEKIDSFEKKELIQNQYYFNGKNISFERTTIFGILNITPDSFSDGGKYLNVSEAVKHAEKLITDGVDVIDIGGESTRPGSDFISVEEELSRVIPVIEILLEKFPSLILSLDTTKSKVAEEGLKRGVTIINDISAGNVDPEILNVVKGYDSGYVAMHMLGTPRIMQINPLYNDVTKDILTYFEEKIKLFDSIGLKKIFIDPGIGFGKTTEHNFELISNIKSFFDFGYPILVGVSRKSFIGKTLNLEINERDAATLAIETYLVNNGVHAIRTHNVKNLKQSITLMEKLKKLNV